MPGVVDVELKVEAGTPLVWHGDFRDVIGHVFAVSPNPDRTDAALQRALDLIELSVGPLPEISDLEKRANVG